MVILLKLKDETHVDFYHAWFIRRHNKSQGLCNNYTEGGGMENELHIEKYYAMPPCQ